MLILRLLGICIATTFVQLFRYFFQVAYTSTAIYSFRYSSSYLFLVFFLFSFETRRLRGDTSFRPEPLRIPPLEDIEFLDDIPIKKQNMRFKSLTNDQTVLRYRYFNFYTRQKVDGKRIFLANAYFENCSVGSEIKYPHMRRRVSNAL